MHIPLPFCSKRPLLQTQPLLAILAVCCIHLRCHKTLHTLWHCLSLSLCLYLRACDKCNNIISPTTTRCCFLFFCLWDHTEAAAMAAVAYPFACFVSLERLCYVIKDLILAAQVKPVLMQLLVGCGCGCVCGVWCVWPHSH